MKKKDKHPRTSNNLNKKKTQTKFFDFINHKLTKELQKNLEYCRKNLNPRQGARSDNAPYLIKCQILKNFIAQKVGKIAL